MIKQFKKAELRYIKKLWLQKYVISVLDKAKIIMIDYFKGLLVTHHLDIYMSGKYLVLNVLRSPRSLRRAVPLWSAPRLKSGSGRCSLRWDEGSEASDAYAGGSCTRLAAQSYGSSWRRSASGDCRKGPSGTPAADWSRNTAS